MKFNRLIVIKALIAMTGLIVFGQSQELVSEKKSAGLKDDYSWMRGANYVPSYAKNDVAIWMDYDSAVIDRELGYAEKLKLNTVRVFLQQAVYEKQPQKFLADFENFVSLCDKHKIKMMPVLFDSCFDPQMVDLKDYRDKKWMPSPGFLRLGEKSTMENYIEAIVGKYKNDNRIVMWDVMNEPDSTSEYRGPESDGRQTIQSFVRWALNRVRQESPVQPLTIGWAGPYENIVTIDLVDIICIHIYRPYQELDKSIWEAQNWGRVYGKPVIMNEFVGRPKQPLELAVPIAAKRKIGWVFWELMLGKTQFTQGQKPYQGHIYPDGTCYSAKEVATILYPEGYSGSAEKIASEAGFKISDKTPRSFTENDITFSPLWETFKGAGPTTGRLWYTACPNETAFKTVKGKRVVLVMKHGPDCGIATVTIDGMPAGKYEIDTYSNEVDWNRRIVVAENLLEGLHRIVVTVSGRKADTASNQYIQIIDILGE